MSLEYDFVPHYPIDRLKPHEYVTKARILEVGADIHRHGLLMPIIADGITKIILDGHHRTAIGVIESWDVIPVVFIDMFAKEVLMGWRRERFRPVATRERKKPGYTEDKFTVVHKVHSGELYPDKTTRFEYDLGDRIVPIGEIVSLKELASKFGEEVVYGDVYNEN